MLAKEPSQRMPLLLHRACIRLVNMGNTFTGPLAGFISEAHCVSYNIKLQYISIISTCSSEERTIISSRTWIQVLSLLVGSSVTPYTFRKHSVTYIYRAGQNTSGCVDHSSQTDTSCKLYIFRWIGHYGQQPHCPLFQDMRLKRKIRSLIQFISISYRINLSITPS